MKVRLAESAGFCMGVRKAMDSVLDVVRGNEITYTLGPLIHNPQALKMLESRNVIVAEAPDEKLAGKTVVTRAHGVPVSVMKKLEEIGAEVLDGTCPKVKNSERIIGKYHELGYTVIIAGDRGHAEIEALLSYTGGAGVVIENVEEAKSLGKLGNVCLVAQTTFNTEKYAEIADEIKKHSDELFIAKTICSATERRQADIKELAKHADATVVVGGRNSANTRRLAEISEELGQPTFLVENAGELDLRLLSGYGEIGVTAGASTPNWVIKEVVDAISNYTPVNRRSLWSLALSAAYFLIEGNFVICAGAAALTYSMCIFMSIVPHPVYLLIAFFYLLPLHTINKFFEINWKQIELSGNVSLLRRYWKFYLSAGFLSLIISLGAAWIQGLLIFSLVAVSYLFGTVYSIRIVPKNFRIRYKSIRDIPGSKDLMIASGWTFATVMLPAITNWKFPGGIFFLGCIFVFVLVISRSILISLGGLQSDKLVGQETIPVILGKERALGLLYGINASLCVLFILLYFMKIIKLWHFMFLLPVAYMIFCISFLGRKSRFFSLYQQMIVDAAFFIAGGISFIYIMK